MKCPQCQKSVEPDSRYCKRCGAKLVRPGARRATKGARSKRKSKASDVHHDPDQERDIWRGRPCWRAFYGAWLLWLILSAACLVAAYRYADADTALVNVVWLFAGGAAAALLAREALVVYGLSYQLTSQRLFIYRGILTRVTDQMELLRIDDVRLSQGVVDRVVDTGCLEIFGSDETDDNVTLEFISTPMEVAEQVRRNVHAVRSKGVLAVESI